MLDIHAHRQGDQGKMAPIQSCCDKVKKSASVAIKKLIIKPESGAKAKVDPAPVQSVVKLSGKKHEVSVAKKSVSILPDCNAVLDQISQVESPV